LDAGCLMLASKTEQLPNTLRGLREAPLDDATVERLDQVWQNLRGITRKYNR
jgi:hypothetical protein